MERHSQIKDFLSEEFWTLDFKFKSGSDVAKFNWARGRVFDREVGLVFFEKCQEAKLATVTSVVKQVRVKYRPQPLNTVEA